MYAQIIVYTMLGIGKIRINIFFPFFKKKEQGNYPIWKMILLCDDDDKWFYFINSITKDIYFAPPLLAYRANRRPYYNSVGKTPKYITLKVYGTVLRNQNVRKFILCIYDYGEHVGKFFLNFVFFLKNIFNVNVNVEWV